MGDNHGALYVQLGKGVDLDTIIKAVETSYLQRGAEPGPARHLPRHGPWGLSKVFELGVAVRLVENGWAWIIDSERYTADAQLARDLARTLHTTVFWELVGDVSLTRMFTRFGPSVPCHGIPGCAAYYDKLEPAEQASWTFRSFTHVKRSSYDSTPAEIPTVKLKCPAGHRFTWRVGEEMYPPSVPDDAAYGTCVVTAPVECLDCAKELHVEFTVDNGVIVGARPGKAPKAPALPKSALWLDGSGRGQPYPSHQIVHLDVDAALRELALDARNQGVGLLAGNIQLKNGVALMGGAKVLRYWTRAAFFLDAAGLPPDALVDQDAFDAALPKLRACLQRE